MPGNSLSVPKIVAVCAAVDKGVPDQHREHDTRRDQRPRIGQQRLRQKVVEKIDDAAGGREERNDEQARGEVSNVAGLVEAVGGLLVIGEEQGVFEKGFADVELENGIKDLQPAHKHQYIQNKVKIHGVLL